MDWKMAAHALYPDLPHADAEAVFLRQAKHGSLPQHVTKAIGRSKLYFLVPQDMAMKWIDEGSCPRLEAQQALVAGIADAFGVEMVFFSLRGRSVLHGEFDTSACLEDLQSLFQGVFGDVIGADGEELLVPTSIDQLRELTLGLVVAGKVPPPCLTAGRAHVIAELEHEDSSAEDSPTEDSPAEDSHAEDSPAGASRIVRPRVDPLQAAADSSSGEQLVIIDGNQSLYIHHFVAHLGAAFEVVDVREP
jgi:hypothetical protein